MVARLSQRAHDVAELLQHVQLATGVRHERRDHVQRVALAGALRPLLSPHSLLLRLIEAAEAPAHLRAIGDGIVVRLAGRELLLIGR